MKRLSDNRLTIKLPALKTFFRCRSLLLISFFFTTKAQTNNTQFEHISLAQGLSQTSVFSIAQDQKGFIWFGTQDGLNKYDGYTFTVYRRHAFDTASLSDNYVTVLLVDRSGTL